MNSTDNNRVSWIYRVVPALDSLRRYGPGDARADFFAGITVAAVAVPQAMAYALAAGLPAQYGLYTAIVMTAVGALFDSSRQLINGPTNAISIAVSAPSRIAGDIGVFWRRPPSVKDSSPVLLPAKAAVPITKSVQVRAKTMLRYGDAGDKMLAAIDGKKDIIDIALSLNMPLPKAVEILNFVRDEGGLVVSQVQRPDVRKKYGEDGFSIYKKFGKEGLMLYELIGKELTIKEMAERVTTDKAKVVDMFLFIYEVLGIEMPINKKALMKQLGL